MSRVKLVWWVVVGAAVAVLLRIQEKRKGVRWDRMSPDWRPNSRTYRDSEDV